jgi:hypothetical protein
VRDFRGVREEGHDRTQGEEHGQGVQRLTSNAMSKTLQDGLDTTVPYQSSVQANLAE